MSNPSSGSGANGAKILVFGGTTEGREILSSGLPCLYSAATEYGAALGQERSDAVGAEGQEIISGRLSPAEMERLAARPEIAGVIDATHPYAAEVSENIARAAESAGKPLFRVLREEGAGGPGITSFPSCAEAAAYLARNEGNALIAVGSKEMCRFAEILPPGGMARFHFRVLPTVEALTECGRLGIPAGNIIAEQGPFSELANRAHIERANARYLVTKDGGPQGGMTEKLEAARCCGVEVLLITRPEELAVASQGSAAEAIGWARQLPNMPKPLQTGSRGLRPLAGCGAEPHGSAPAPMFPLFVSLVGKPALIVGGGRVAARKAATLLRCGASVRVVAPEISPALDRLREEGRITVARRAYEPGDCDGARIIVAATDDRATNERVRGDAGDTPVNVADDPASCSFFFPSFVEHDGFAAGVSSAGQSPARCRALADKLRLYWKEWVEDVCRAG